MENMWINANANRVSCVKIFVQDKEFEMDQDYGVGYLLPVVVPPIVGRFDHGAYYATAMEYQRYDDEAGPAKIGMKELRGKR